MDADDGILASGAFDVSSAAYFELSVNVISGTNVEVEITIFNETNGMINGLRLVPTLSSPIDFSGTVALFEILQLVQGQLGAVDYFEAAGCPDGTFCWRLSCQSLSKSVSLFVVLIMTYLSRRQLPQTVVLFLV